MSLQHEIKQAYDAVHAPDALTERLKRELYRSDLREDAVTLTGEAEMVTCEVEEAPKRRPFLAAAKGIAYLAASLALCAGCGLAVWGLRDGVVDFHPGANVSAPAHATIPDVNGRPATEAGRMLEELGFRVEYRYNDRAIDAADLPDGGTVFRMDPSGGTEADRGTAVVLYISADAA